MYREVIVDSQTTHKNFFPEINNLKKYREYKTGVMPFKFDMMIEVAMIKGSLNPIIYIFLI